MRRRDSWGRIDDNEEALVDDLDASDYEWEREMHEMWPEFDESYA